MPLFHQVIVQNDLLLAPQKPEMSIKTIDFYTAGIRRGWTPVLLVFFQNKYKAHSKCEPYHKKTRFEEREFLQLQVCNKWQRRSLSRRAQSVCYSNTDSGKEKKSELQ